MTETGSDSWIPDVRLALTNYERLLAGLLDLYPPEPMPRADPVFEDGLLTWQVLPPGHLDILYPPAGATHRPTPATGGRGSDHTRIPFLRSLGEPRVWRGSHLAQRIYVVAEFRGVAIADTETYGNALFYFEGDGNEWQRVFRRDKSEAVRLGAGRIPHSGDWQQRVRELVRGAR